MIFKLANYFLPLCFIAFVKQNFLALFTLNLTTLFFGELKAKVIGYLLPKLKNFYRKRLDPKGMKALDEARNVF